MKKSVAALGNEFGALRTGRASAALFDKIKVDYYGQETPLSQVASISVPEARLVVIQPWDKSLLGPIEKAILKSELSLNPNNDGKLLRINFPPLTEDRRKELAKNAKAIAEQSKIAIRNIRREAIDEIKSCRRQETSPKTSRRISKQKRRTLPMPTSRRSPIWLRKKKKRYWKFDRDVG